MRVCIHFLHFFDKRRLLFPPQLLHLFSFALFFTLSRLTFFLPVDWCRCLETAEFIFKLSLRSGFEIGGIFHWLIVLLLLLYFPCILFAFWNIFGSDAKSAASDADFAAHDAARATSDTDYAATKSDFAAYGADSFASDTIFAASDADFSAHDAYFAASVALYCCCLVLPIKCSFRCLCRFIVLLLPFDA